MEKSAYLISYDLKNGNSDAYENIFEYIKSYGTWAHITESLWAVITDKPAQEIRDEIRDIIPKGSALLVVKSGVESAWSHVLCTHQWLKNYL